VIDPSQGCGNANLVETLCFGAVAMGADGLLIEVHPDPTRAWSDGAQQVTLEAFEKLTKNLLPFLHAAGRE
jgi:3-deoxy-7-phosphoheptulonate synthase